MKKIVVLGFGRSGTTWISDIISKTLGKLILFEPFHPSVTRFSAVLSYSGMPEGDKIIKLLKEYLSAVLNCNHRKPWLMRNHVPCRLEEVSPGFLHTLWAECKIGGFKEIRANFLSQWLKKELDATIVFIIRHPLAVVASIKKRSNFWEFGWPQTYDLFLEKTLNNENCTMSGIQNLRNKVLNFQTEIQKIAAMWAITHAICLPQLKEINIPIFYYEDFYSFPFTTTRRLLNYLGSQRANLHPSFLFTPSMTTLKTLHGMYSFEREIKNGGAAFFWKNVLSPEEIDMIMDIIAAFEIDIYDKGGFPKSSLMNIHDLSDYETSLTDTAMYEMGNPDYLGTDEFPRYPSLQINKVYQAKTNS